MSNLLPILNTVLPVVIVLGLGMLCRSRKLLSRQGVNDLKSVAVNIALPAVMLNAFATMEYSVKSILLTILMFGVCVVAWLLGGVFRKLLGGSRFIPFLTTGFEAGMLGYALFGLLYGSGHISEFAGIDLGQVLFVFTLYKILLSLEGKEKITAADLGREMISSPTFVAIVVGILIGATGLYRTLAISGWNTLLDACTSFISAPTSCIILLAIGYDLVFEEVPWSSVGKAVACRLVIMLALRLAAGAVVRLIGMRDTLDHALNVMMILPPPYVLPVFADDEKERSFVASTLSVLTLITIVGFIALAVMGI